MLLLLAGCTSPTPSPDPGWRRPADDDVIEIVGDSTAAPPGLVLNELLPDNDSTWMLADGSYPDLVELYNAGEGPVALAQVRLVSAGGAWAGTEGELAPGERLLLTGALPLDGDGDVVELWVGSSRIDRVSTGPVPGDVVVARYPDGGAWAPSIRATPGWTNGNAPSESVDPSSVFFENLTDVRLYLSDASWEHLAADPYTEVEGSLAFEGAFFPKVSVRRKGVYGSLRSMDQKAAFKVDINEYQDQRLRGLETLTFNNMVQDWTYVHEYLTYGLYRALDLPAPRVGWSRVWVNDTYFGLYANVETVDDTFLARWYADPSGNLYEGAYGVDFYQGYESYFECDECVNPDDRSDITAVSTVLDQAPSAESWAALQALVDMDQLTLYMAVEAAAWHWDGYTTSNNYRVYHDPTDGRFTMLPWGTDQTWVDEWYAPYTGYGRIHAWCMTWPECRALYSRQLDVVADRIEELDLDVAMRRWLAELEPDIEADPRKEWYLSGRQDYLSRTEAEILAAPDRLRAASE